MYRRGYATSVFVIRRGGVAGSELSYTYDVSEIDVPALDLFRKRRLEGVAQ
jgi:hypothetical protein